MEGKVEGIAIRTASTDDAPEIARVHINSWSQAHSGVLPAAYLQSIDPAKRTEHWREILSHPEISTWVATAPRLGVVGFASLGAARDDDTVRGTLELYSIYLKPELWGQGVARNLMRSVLAEIDPRTAITLWVLADNARARQFYRRHGFSEDGTERLESFADTEVLEVRFRR